MKKKILFLLFLLSAGIQLFSQVSINNNGNNPDPSAMLDIQSGNRGLLIPRLTHSEMNSIIDPANGLMVFCTDCGSNGLGTLSIFIGGTWMSLNASCMNPSPPSAGIHVPSFTQIVWNWNQILGATGYKWNTINNYSTAIDLGNVTSKTESGLECSTSYTRYIWAYNDCGNSYPLMTVQTSLNCMDEPGVVLDLDGNVYHTVTIGTQIWMVENLKTTKYKDGTNIAQVQGYAEWYELDTPGYCWYDNNPSNKIPYGAIYNWFAVNTGKLAPVGWHVPTDDDMTTLINYLGGVDSGGKLKETGLNHWMSPNVDATNETGFTALPSGSRDPGGVFSLMGYYWQAWSATETNATNSGFFSLSTDNKYINLLNYSKKTGFSVRCIKDL